MIAALRTAIFFTGWVALTCILGILGLPLLASRCATRRLATAWARLTLIWLRFTTSIHTEQRGDITGQLFASKHQSALDTLMLWLALDGPAFVLKRELYRIPIFGWYLCRTGHIAIDRRAAREALAQIEAQAQPLLARGRRIVIFPEGTRIRPGDHKPFRAGIARVSQLLQQPVTPVALNAGHFWPKYSLVKKPGIAMLQFLPLMPVCGDNHTNWMQQLEATVNTASDALSPRPE